MSETDEPRGHTAPPLVEKGHAWAEDRHPPGRALTFDSSAWKQPLSPPPFPGSLVGGMIGGELLGWRDSASLPSHSRKVLTGKKVATDLAKIRSVLDASITLDNTLSRKAMSMSHGSRVIVSQLEHGRAVHPTIARNEVTVPAAPCNDIAVESAGEDSPNEPRERSGTRKKKSNDPMKKWLREMRKAKKANRKRSGNDADASVAQDPPAFDEVDEPGGQPDKLLSDDEKVVTTATASRKSFQEIRGNLKSNTSQSLGLKMSTSESSNGGTCTWHGKLIRLVTMPKFDTFFGSLILANTVVMAMQVQYRGLETGKQIDYYGIDKHANEIWPGADVAFDILDWAFGVIFSIEILLKLGAFHIRFFQDLWNILDALVVAAWAVEAGAGDVELPLDPMLLRLLRLVKLLRMLRLIRTIQGFDSLYVMITAIKGSLSALLWSTLMLLVVLMMIALLLVTLSEAYIIDKSNPTARRNLVYKYFGTFSRTGLTMFEMTLANWVPPSRALTENVSEWLMIFALVFKASLGFSVVKVIMGVFLQVTFDVAENDDLIMVNRAERAIRGHSAKMGSLFKAADEDGNGRLDLEEFSKIIGDPVVVTWLGAMGFEATNFNAKDVYKLLLEGSDKDDMNAEELVTGFSRLKGSATSLNMTVVQRGNHETLETVRKLGHKIDVHTGGVQEVEGADIARSVSGESSFSAKLKQSSKASARSRVSVSETMFAVKDGVNWNEAAQLPLASRLHWMLHRFVTSFHFEICFAVLIFSNTMVMCAEMQYRGLKNGSELLHPNPALHPNTNSDNGLLRDDICSAAQQLMTNAGNGTTLLATALANASVGPTQNDCIPWSPPADQIWPHAENVFKYLEYSFGFAFTLEIVLKVVALGRRFPRELWNILDTAIVGFWYVEAFTATALPFDPMLMRLFRLLRLLRMARLVKVFEKFDALYLMLTSIKASIAALAWSSVFLIIFQTLLALIMTTIMEGWLRDDKSTGDKALVFLYWGTFSRSMLTLFEISLANFLPVTRAMMDNVSELYLIFALVHKFCMGFAVVMVITGVFVQETVKVAQTDNTIMLNQRERSAKQHFRKMSALFAVADADGSGRLDKDEFEQICQDPSVVSWLSAMGIDVSDAGTVHTLISEKLGLDDLDAMELVKGMAFVKGTARNMDMAMLRKDTHMLQGYVEQLEGKVGKLLKAKTAKRRHAG